MSFFRFSCCIAAAIFLAGPEAGRAQGSNVATGLLNGGFSVRTWQTEDGLPQNSVCAVQQTRDGYLWVGTYGGLARFDGARFQTFDANNTPELGDARIVSLHEDREGVLWIGHDSGRVTRYRSGRFEAFRSRAPFSDQRVAAIDSDSAGAVWLLRQSGALECVDGRTIPARPGVAQSMLLSLVRSAEGDLYVEVDGDVARLIEGKLQPVDFGGSTHSGFVMGVGRAQSGGAWIVRDWSVRKWNGHAWDSDRGPVPWGGDTALSAVLELHDGNLAVGTMERGLFIFYPDGRVLRFDRSNGLPQNWVRSLFEDREGNLWAGVGSGGLVQIAPSAFSILTPPDQWQGRTELCVAASRDGSLWIGTEGAGLYRHHDGAWKHYGEVDGLGHSFVWSVAEDPAGRIWAGTWGGGIYRFDGERFGLVGGHEVIASPVFALQFSPDNRALWIGTGRGLLRWQDDGASWAFGGSMGENEMIWTVARDGAGAIWFGISDGGLGRITAAGVARFHHSDGLAGEAVQCLLAEPDSTLWIGTAGWGLGRFKNGRFATIGMKEGLASNVICHIIDDGRGYLWMSSRNGILRVAKKELDRCADGLSATVAAQVYNRSDGLPTVEFSGGLQSSGCMTSDGRLWFTSSKGVICVDPANVRSNPEPPPMALEELQVDNQSISPGEKSGLRFHLQPGHRRIEFHYTALSLTAPSKVQFKYRLEGLENDWVDAGTKRVASYSHLPAGAYRFHVIACNNDGVWNNQGVSLALTVLPFFWQTWWFRGVATLAVLTVVGWIVRNETRRRMQRRVEHWEQQHAIERERARIAQDIHDDIGASLTRISMLSQSATEDPHRSPQTMDMLDRIYDTTRDVTRALDEIVWAVDPRHDSLDSLVGYMGKFAQDFLGAANVRCRLDLPVILPVWSVTAEVRHHLFLAFKEALNNALKHARPTEVRIALTILPQAFELSIADDGQGFGPPENNGSTASRFASGNGLDNFRRRLAQIGGRCEVVSRAGSGTRVAFVIGRP